MISATSSCSGFIANAGGGNASTTELCSYRIDGLGDGVVIGIGFLIWIITFSIFIKWFKMRNWT